MSKASARLKKKGKEVQDCCVFIAHLLYVFYVSVSEWVNVFFLVLVQRRLKVVSLCVFFFIQPVLDWRRQLSEGGGGASNLSHFVKGGRIHGNDYPSFSYTYPFVIFFIFLCFFFFFFPSAFFFSSSILLLLSVFFFMLLLVLVRRVYADKVVPKVDFFFAEAFVLEWRV